MYAYIARQQRDTFQNGLKETATEPYKTKIKIK